MLQAEQPKAKFRIVPWLNSDQRQFVQKQNDASEQRFKARTEELEAQVADVPFVNHVNGSPVYQLLQKRLDASEQTIRELLTALKLFHDRQDCPWCYDDGQCDVADIINKFEGRGGDQERKMSDLYDTIKKADEVDGLRSQIQQLRAMTDKLAEAMKDVDSAMTSGPMTLNEARKILRAALAEYAEMKSDKLTSSEGLPTDTGASGGTDGR